jgi:hypothetical protein
MVVFPLSEYSPKVLMLTNKIWKNMTTVHRNSMILKLMNKWVKKYKDLACADPPWV